MSHVYDVGTKAWQPDAQEGWVASEVKQKKINGDKVTLVFQLDNGEVSHSFSTLSPTWCCANDSRPKPSRPPWPRWPTRTPIPPRFPHS